MPCLSWQRRIHISWRDSTPLPLQDDVNSCTIDFVSFWLSVLCLGAWPHSSWHCKEHVDNAKTLIANQQMALQSKGIMDMCAADHRSQRLQGIRIPLYLAINASTALVNRGWGGCRPSSGYAVGASDSSGTPYCCGWWLLAMYTSLASHYIASSHQLEALSYEVAALFAIDKIDCTRVDIVISQINLSTFLGLFCPCVLNTHIPCIVLECPSSGWFAIAVSCDWSYTSTPLLLC